MNHDLENNRWGVIALANYYADLHSELYPSKEAALEAANNSSSLREFMNKEDRRHFIVKIHQELTIAQRVIYSSEPLRLPPPEPAPTSPRT